MNIGGSNNYFAFSGSKTYNSTMPKKFKVETGTLKHKNFTKEKEAKFKKIGNAFELADALLYLII